MKMELNIHDVVGIKVSGYNLFDNFVSRRIVIQTEQTDWDNKKEDGTYNKHIVEIKIDVISRSESEQEGINNLKITKSEKKVKCKKVKG